MYFYCLVFLAVSTLLWAACQVALHYWDVDAANVRRRLADEFTQATNGEVKGTLFKNVDAMTLAPIEEYALLEQGMPSAPPVQSLRERIDAQLQQAGITIRLEYFVAAGFVLGAAGLAVGWWFLPGPGFLLGIAGLFAPFIYIRVKHAARTDKFLRQLPSAFDLMARVIRAGQSVPQAFQAVAEAFDDPLAQEFRNCQHQESLGLRPEIVLREMANRSAILELRIFVMAMGIQRQSGGNLSEVLERLATLVRNRLRLRQQVRTYTAEGRLQGLTLLVLPFLMFAAMFFINRTYAQALLDHPSLLWGTGALMTVGMVWIRRIVSF